jgi:Zn-dependent protease with chaperone function
MANAMVVGVLPQARYVVFTDRLLHELSEDEVDAVFGHEVGHARHGHLVYYALFLVLSVLTVGALYEVLRKSNWFVGKETQTWLIVGPVLFMGLYMFLVFGFLSRRCERQADLFGCRAGSCHDPNCDRHHDTTPLAPNGIGLCPTGIEAFIRALRRVEEINGMTRTRTEPRRGLLNSVFQWFGVLLVWLQTWQHSTIEKRVAFLRRVRDDLEIERRFQKRVFLIRILILGTLIAVLISVAVLWGSDVLLGAL